MDKDVLWKGIKHSCRKQVKKAIKGNFTFEKVTDPCTFERHLDSYYKMAIDVYARQGLPPYIDKTYFRDLFMALNKTKVIIYMVSTPDGIPVAGIIIGIHKNKAVGLDAVSLGSYHKFGINNYLYWNMINSLKEMGVVNYDFGYGGFRGLDNFKKSFGTDTCPTFYAEKSFSLLAKGAKYVYAKTKAFEKN